MMGRCSVACCRQLLLTNRPPLYSSATVAKKIKRTDTSVTSAGAHSTYCIRAMHACAHKQHRTSGVRHWYHAHKVHVTTCVRYICTYVQRTAACAMATVVPRWTEERVDIG